MVYTLFDVIFCRSNKRIVFFLLSLHRNILCDGD